MGALSADQPNAARRLPAVDRLIRSAGGAALIAQYGREAAVKAMRMALSAARARLQTETAGPIEMSELLDAAAAQLHRQFRPTLRPVINATGIIIHTNLGRAPLSEAALRAMQAVGGGYSSLEYDLETGKRGSRLIHAEHALCELTGAEGALVVNNNAAALVLILSALAHGKEVILSRGQLIEIGGGFRLPEVMQQSGARLVEVGTTNRTRPADYERAITSETALLMRAHASNFKQIGFVESASVEEVAAIAHRHGLLAVDDLGSGALLDTAQYGLDHEPTPQESLTAGMDVVAFSGDKLLGGPQAGIILGRRALIDQLKQHPLARSLRADKLCLSALAATLDHYRRGEAAAQIPVWRMIARTHESLRGQAELWAAQLRAVGLAVEVIDGVSAVGGGSLPGETLPTALLALAVPDAEAFTARLRAADPPVIARIADGRVLIDGRTVLPDQEHDLLRVLRELKR